MAHKILYLIMAAAAAALQLGFGDGLVALIFPEHPTQDSLVVDIALGVALGLGVVVASRGISRIFQWAQRLDAELRELLRPMGPRQVLGLAFSSAFAEELLFRGFLQPRLGLVWASLLFGLAHIPQRRHHVPWTVAAIGMGFAFGWLFETQGSLVAPFLAHFLINTFNMHNLLRPLTPAEQRAPEGCP